jgi:predicted anti-sigma-YlaC factor YlaD
MKLSCEIIKDLLPLYHDDVCSNDSKIMVEEHLAQCDDCKAELQSMYSSVSIGNMEQNLNEAEAVKKLSKEWKKGKLKSLLEGILITAVIAIILYCFADIKLGTK